MTRLACTCVVVVLVESTMEPFIGIWYFVPSDAAVVIKLSIHHKYMQH